METGIHEIWESNRDYLRRLLIGLTHDLDLADDLLQEAYLQALKGFPQYRGENSRAWLAAIAKNAFYAHARRKYYGSEKPLDADITTEAEDVPGSANHIDVLAVRQAINSLSESLRKPLIMKHYGDLTYKEIAERLAIPQGTAQQRVWTALQKLRSALGVQKREEAIVTCENLMGKILIDFIYGKLSDREAKTVREHLEQCSSCRSETEEIGETLRALDAVEGAFKWAGILELDDNGYSTLYITLLLPNDSDKPVEMFDFGAGREAEVVFVALDGEEASFEELPTELDSPNRRYIARPASPIPPRQPIEFLLIGRNPTKPGVEKVGEGRYRVGPCKISLTEDLVYVMAVRLPPKAVLAEATPEPQDVKQNGVTTVVWRNVLPANNVFEFLVEYKKA